MKFDIKNWIENFSNKILKSFGKRVEFIGLQGSYAREEATNSSDIDVVVILDKISFKDLKKYDTIISEMENREKICGFISGKDEIINWEKSDLFQFYYDTKKIYKNLDFILEKIKKEDIQRAVLIGAGNIYHMSVHNIVHDKSIDLLKDIYKMSFFILQGKYFLENNIYLKNKKEALESLNGMDKKILEIGIEIKNIGEMDKNQYEDYSEKILLWSSELIKKYNIG